MGVPPFVKLRRHQIAHFVKLEPNSELRYRLERLHSNADWPERRTPHALFEWIHPGDLPTLNAPTHFP
jgi:hypothetical protein